MTCVSSAGLGYLHAYSDGARINGITVKYHIELQRQIFTVLSFIDVHRLYSCRTYATHISSLAYMGSTGLFT